ncbi:MAG TPA: TnsA-like heteromeric transposase endonuclease subunit [Streptosporangiaceae bacterium]|nr:TnsA-like heteromeric transposase endonuclease subunit [Streptosporangiaceae bacterium]
MRWFRCAWRMADGGETSLPLRRVQARHVLAAVPWRKTRSARGQAHYPGYFWSATMGAHVIYESRLELARLLLADFDPDVTAIAAQPFLLRALAGGRPRRHVPDFLLAHADKSVRVVNVKPAGKLAEPRIAEALAWPGQLIEDHGWQYEIWSGADPVLLANLRFLAGYRRPGLLPGYLLDDVLAAVRPGDTIGAVISRMSGTRRPGDVKAAVLRLLWQQRLATDLRGRLDAGSILEMTA